MLKLNLEQITVVEKETKKEEAIKYVGGLLVKKGLVEDSYIKGMLDREAQITTYIDNGIAIPHGSLATKDFVKMTGVEVVFYKKGVDWGDGNLVHLVVGIAAKGEEHLDILRSLTTTLMDDDLFNKFQKVESNEDVLNILLNEPVSDDSKQSVVNGNTACFTINNPQGLHARPCAELVKVVKKIESDVQVRNKTTGSQFVSAKSMMKVISLGVKKGHVLEFTVDGQNSDESLKIIGDAIAAGLGE